jgi:CelD/BcsL family acetyltransferase involved in cellulose biosynthesis
VKVRVLKLEELDRDAWDKLMDSTPKSGVFHTWHWAAVLEQSFESMEAVFFVIEDGDGYLCGLPAVVESRPPVKRFLSMPFGSYGGLVAGNAERAEQECLAQEVCRYSSERGMWHSEIADFYGTCTLDSLSGFRRNDIQSHLIDLSGGFDLVWREKFNKNVRKMVRQARRKGVTVKSFSGQGDLERYTLLAEHTLKRRGSMTRELALYSNCIKLMGPPGHARGHLAWWEGKPVAGAIHLVDKRMAMNWLSASDSRYWHVRPNNLVVSRVIEEMCKEGAVKYNFGSSPDSAKELIRYKESWGAEKYLYSCLTMSTNAYRALRLVKRIAPFQP